MVDAGLEVEAGTVVEEVEQGELTIVTWKPAVRGGVILPEFADAGSLPAAHGGLDAQGRLLVSQTVFMGPPADLSLIHI